MTKIINKLTPWFIKNENIIDAAALDINVVLQKRNCGYFVVSFVNLKAYKRRRVSMDHPFKTTWIE